MRVRMISGAAVAALLLAGGGLVAADVKSGPAVGKSLFPFHPLNINGPAAGRKNCLV